MANNATILDLDALMDSTLDAIADVPDFINPPAGLYQLAVTDAALDEYKSKDGSKASRFKITYKVVDTIETTECPVSNGSLFTETFQATEQGLSFFKKQAKALLGVDISGVPLREILANLKGIELEAKITVRKSSKDGKDYENISVRPVQSATA